MTMHDSSLKLVRLEVVTRDLMSSIAGDHESLGNIHLPAKNVSNMLGKQHRILLFPGIGVLFSQPNSFLLSLKVA